MDARRSLSRRAVLRLLAMAPLALLAGLPARAATRGPRPVQLVDDRCPACGMAVMDARFAALAVTDGGRTLVYDAVECMADHRNGHAGPAPSVAEAYLADRAASSREEAVWCDVDDAVVLHHPRLRTPMGGGLAAFCSDDAARAFAEAQGYGEPRLLGWREVLEVGADRPWVEPR